MFCISKVSDVDQIMGLVQAENIQVHAESYDVALDMSFPKGTLVDNDMYGETFTCVFIWAVK